MCDLLIRFSYYPHLSFDTGKKLFCVAPVRPLAAVRASVEVKHAWSTSRVEQPRQSNNDDEDDDEVKPGAAQPAGRPCRCQLLALTVNCDILSRDGSSLVLI